MIQLQLSVRHTTSIGVLGSIEEYPDRGQKKPVFNLDLGIFPRSRYIYDTFLEYAQFLLIWHPISPFGIFMFFYMNPALNLEEIYRLN